MHGMNMRSLVAATLAAALTLPAAADNSAARALVNEFGITTQSVSKVASNIYEASYSNYQLVTDSCWVGAYAEAAVVTSTQIIFIDLNEVCAILETRPKE
jgi:hypothetical protein